MRTDASWERDTVEGGDLMFVGPPWPWLLLTLLVLIAALALVPFGGRSIPWHALGYLLSGVVGTCLVAFYRRGDVRRRGNPFYAPVPIWDRLAGVLAVAAIVIAAIHAWALATAWST